MMLSGLVALLSDDGSAVLAARDLGSAPVAVKPGRVLPLVEVIPSLSIGEQLGAYSDEIGPDHVTRIWSAMPVPAPSPEDVIAERARRLAAGFDFDFGDPRGTHRIGTTEADMVGWDEVSKLAQARLAIGDTTPIAIVTDTGPTSVTPAEWIAILLASAAYRQPIWQASFALQAMDPIPADYSEDGYWM